MMNGSVRSEGGGRTLWDQGCTASAVAELAQECMVLIDDSMAIVAANAAFANIPREDLESPVEGRTLGMVLQCRHAAHGACCCGSEACRTCGWFQAVHACRARGSGESECRILTPDCRAYDFMIRVRPVPQPSAGGGAWICSLTDLYARKRLRVMEKAFFHDVINHAVGIRGITELLEEGGEDVAALHEMLHNSAVRLVFDIERLRTLRVAENGDVRVWCSPHEPDALVRTALQRYQDEIEARRLSLDVAGGPGASGASLDTDAELFLLVFGDLLLNAIEASGRGERLTVRWAEESGRMVFSVGNAAVLEQAVLDHLFERSFTTKGEGRGVGAYRAKLIAERFMEGRVWFTSRAPEGTVFYVSFPKAAASDT